MLSTAHEELADALRQPHILLAPLPLPTVALRVTNMSEEECDAATLAGLIQRDAGLAAQIIRVANSALYARRNPVTSLQQAISWLGIAEVRKVTISCALRARLFAGKDAERALAPAWAESLATACFSQEIARLQRRGVEQAYLGGLLHRGGYAAMIQMLVRSETSARLLADEHALADLAAAHEAALARHLAQDWGLPDSVAAALRWWREPGAAEALQLPRPARQSLAEVLVARSLAARLPDSQAMENEELPPEVAAAAADPAAELGLYQEDLSTLWNKREMVVAVVESLQ
jgi:HD-like signal output (HDOD) protein